MIFFCGKGLNSTTKKDKYFVMSGRVHVKLEKNNYRRKGAPLRTDRVQIWPEEPISGFRRLIPGLREPVSCMKGPSQA